MICNARAPAERKNKTKHTQTESPPPEIVSSLDQSDQITKTKNKKIPTSTAVFDCLTSNLKRMDVKSESNIKSEPMSPTASSTEPKNVQDLTLFVSQNNVHFLHF